MRCKRAGFAGFFVLASALPGCPLGSSKGGDGSADVSKQAGEPLPKPPPGAATTHPRLLVREVDLPRLRGWANDSNPMFAKGLKALVDGCVQTMDEGGVFKDDPGSPDGYAANPPEAYAMLFAFYSLIAPQEERVEYARRAKKLLMAVIEKAGNGAAADQPFRDPKFS